MDCGRLTLQGTVVPVPDADKARLREIFLKKYPSVSGIEATPCWVRYRIGTCS
jgi:hypothetical protein